MKKIIYVDDEIYTSKMDSKIELIQTYGFEIVRISSVETALEDIQKLFGQVSLLILDLIMPPEDKYSLEETNGGTTTGIRLLKDIRRVNKEIKIMIISVRRKENLREELENYNIAEFLEKPISAREIGETINRILNQ